MMPIFSYRYDQRHHLLKWSDRLCLTLCKHALKGSSLDRPAPALSELVQEAAFAAASGHQARIDDDEVRSP